MSSKKNRQKIRGVFEKVPGSDVWWIQYFDASGRRRREKAGRRSDAITLLSKRKTEKLQRKKLPENLRTKPVTFGELANDAVEHSQAENGERSTREIALEHFQSRCIVNPAMTEPGARVVWGDARESLGNRLFQRLGSSGFQRT